MTSPDRAEISRQNSRRSTGPKSEIGKSRSKYNALKHGLTAKLPVLPQEDPEAFRGAWRSGRPTWTLAARSSGS